MSGHDVSFNNAMAEMYDYRYTKMGYHSDQALDLAPDSWICIFSCYEDRSEAHPKILVIKDKVTRETSELVMEYGSVVMFSTTTNERYLHKIVSKTQQTQSTWLGITFRLSKTFVHYANQIPYLGNRVLTIASDQERKEFCRHKRAENEQIGYDYPDIHYTLNSVT